MANSRDPAETRSGVAMAGGLEGLKTLLGSGKEASCALALDVAAAYGDDDCKQVVIAFVERMPSDALKARAAKNAGD